MSTFTFYYFALKNLYAKDDTAELKQRDVKAIDLSEAERKFYGSGRHGNITRDVYQIDCDGELIWTQNQGLISK